MKILHVDDGKGWGGGQRQVFYLLRGLIRRGVDVLLACRRGAPLAQRVEGERIPVLPLPMRGSLDVVSAWRLGRCIRRFAPDLIHAHTSHAHTAVLTAAWMVGGKRVPLVVHRRVVRRPRASGLVGGWKYAGSVDAYICVSRAVREAMEAAGIEGNRLHVIPSGVDVSSIEEVDALEVKREFSLPPDAFVMGGVGSLVRAKGFDMLLAAAARVMKEYDDARLLLVGEGPEEKHLRGMAAEHGIAERVVFAGFREDVLSLLKGLDVLMVSSRAEGLNTTMLDAMAAGVPVVTFETGGIVDAAINGKTALTVEPGDVEGMAGAVRRLREDRHLRECLTASARDLVRSRFNVDVMVEGVVAVYEEVLKESERCKGGQRC